MASRDHTRSKALYEEALNVIPGGVNSPVRAFRAVGGTPLFMARGEGAYVFDEDGNRYLDAVGSWGPMIHGHAHPRILAAIEKAARFGTSFGAPCRYEVEMAQLVCSLLPAVDKVRLVSSGTEAAMSALRVARGFTGRSKIVKFEGCYHGHTDSLLVKAGSGALTLGTPDSAGVPPEIAALTLTLPFNDSAAVDACMQVHGAEVAAIIVEPIVGNMGVVTPQSGFLEHLRSVTEQHGALLIFDEVMTGFRVGLRGVAGLTGIRPDLTMMGKVIGGGLPVAAYGGRSDVMDKVAPLGPVYQAGTLSGNPLAVAAGLESLRMLVEDASFYARLEEKGRRIQETLLRATQATGVPATVNRAGSMVTLFFCEGPVTDYTTARRADTAMYSRFFHACLERGLALPPSQFEAAFFSQAHETKELDEFDAIVHDAMTEVAAATMKA